MEISVVSPVYNSKEILDVLVDRLSQVLNRISNSHEIILVDDGCTDDSWTKIKEICSINPNVKGIKLSRNFGQHNAITAGLNEANGENLVIIDCDLQNDPNDIECLFNKIKIGYDIVFTKRRKRKLYGFKEINSWIYNKMFRLFGDINFGIDMSSLVIFTKKVKVEFLKIKDKDRLYLQILKWLGFKSTIIEVEQHKRYQGKSGYTFYKLINIGLQGITSHSKKLLWYSIYSGLILSFLSFCVGVSILLRFFFHSFQPGWPSLFVAITFSTGLVLLSIGILGIYIGKTFEQVKDRPLYVIDEKIN